VQISAEQHQTHILIFVGSFFRMHLGFFIWLLFVFIISVHIKDSYTMVIITAVNPSRGSLAGGTRMVIRGSGFSTNTGGIGNVVYIGSKYQCDPVLLHCTINQIVCKTRPAMEGYGPMSMFEDNAGFGINVRTGVLDVTVLVDGTEHSTCIPPAGKACTFQYRTDWFHTPRIDSLIPRTVSTGSMLTISGIKVLTHLNVCVHARHDPVERAGRFFADAFAFDKTRAPTGEVALASVRVFHHHSSLHEAPPLAIMSSGDLFTPPLRDDSLPGRSRW
jgi:hypothetical protein